MSPSKFEDREVTKGVMNGARPSPLKISKESHSIHKPSNSSSSSGPQQAVIDNSSSAHHSAKQQSHPKRQPVIIYTHSPKVIHAQARDFMALVQKLTGLSRAEQDEKTTTGHVKSESESTRDDGSFSEEKDCAAVSYKHGGGSYDQDNESSSVLTDEKFVGELKQDSSAVSPMYKVSSSSSNPYLVDAPLFTPNSNDQLFCSPRPNPLFQSAATMANSISPPSFMDFMRGFPEY